MSKAKTNSTKQPRRGKTKIEQAGGSSFRAQVVAEYLAGDCDQRTVASRHGISQTSLSLWTKAYLEQKEGVMSKREKDASPQALSAELARLRKELEEQKLRNLALEELIEVAEKKFKLPIRKKPGAKQ